MCKASAASFRAAAAALADAAAASLAAAGPLSGASVAVRTAVATAAPPLCEGEVVIVDRGAPPLVTVPVPVLMTVAVAVAGTPFLPPAARAGALLSFGITLEAGGVTGLPPFICTSSAFHSLLYAEKAAMMSMASRRASWREG